MRGAITIAVSAVTIIGSGIWQGAISGRWQTTAPSPAEAVALQELPLTLGDWEGATLDYSAEQLRTAEAVGHLSRRYVNGLDGSVISLLILYGPAGPISLHSPTACFPGAGFHQETEPARRQVSDGGISAEFAVADFRKEPSAVPLHIRTYWSWFGSGSWQVPTSPRVAFARQSRLFKMYVTQSTAGARRDSSDDACLKFIQSALPELQRAVQSR